MGNYFAVSHKLMGGATLLQMGLRGVLVCYLEKKSILCLAAEIVIIYLFIRIYFLKVHLSFVLRTRHIIKCIR